jgi:Zn-finger protein
VWVRVEKKTTECCIGFGAFALLFDFCPFLFLFFCLTTCTGETQRRFTGSDGWNCPSSFLIISRLRLSAKLNLSSIQDVAGSWYREREREIREPSTCIVVQKEAYRAEFLCSMGWFFVRSTTCNFFFFWLTACLPDCLTIEKSEKKKLRLVCDLGVSLLDFFRGCFFHFGHICCLRSLTCKAVL